MRRLTTHLIVAIFTFAIGVAAPTAPLWSAYRLSRTDQAVFGFLMIGGIFILAITALVCGWARYKSILGALLAAGYLLLVLTVCALSLYCLVLYDQSEGLLLIFLASPWLLLLPNPLGESIFATMMVLGLCATLNAVVIYFTVARMEVSNQKATALAMYRYGLVRSKYRAKGGTICRPRKCRCKLIRQDFSSRRRVRRCAPPPALHPHTS